MTGHFADLCEQLAATLASVGAGARKDLDRSEPMYLRYLDYRASLAGSFMELDPRELGQPIHYSSMSETAVPEPGYLAHTLRALDVRAQRGLKLPFVSPAHCVMTMAFVSPAGRYAMRVRRFTSYHPRERQWVHWGHHLAPHRTAELSELVQILVGLQYTAQRTCRVLFGHPGAPRIAVACQDEEAKVLEGVRALPPSPERRERLRAWLTEHWARIDGGDGSVLVAPARDVTWEALECTIVPSEARASTTAPA